MQLTFKPLTEENYEQAFKLQLACHAYPWSRKVFVDCLTPPYFAYAAVSEDQIVGFFVGLQVLDEVTLMDIGIASELRGNGFGQQMLEQVIQLSKEKKAVSIWLEVRQSNASAIHIYQKAGFDLIETRKNYYPTAEGREDAKIMQLILETD